MSDSAPDTAKTSATCTAFLDRYEGVYVTAKTSLGHPLTLRLYRRTFALTSRNYHYLAVMAPIAFRNSETHAIDIRKTIDEYLDRAIGDTEQDLQELRTWIGDSKAFPTGCSAHTHAVEVKLITPHSRKHLTLLERADQLLLTLEALWIQGALTDEIRSRGQFRIKRRLNAVAMMARESCVKLMRARGTRA